MSDETMPPAAPGPLGPGGDADSRFAERIARPLRASERLSDDFEVSLLAAIRADRPLDRPVARRTPLAPRWWSTPLTFHLSPLAGLALAASVAAIASLSALRVSGALRPLVPAPRLESLAQVHDTVNVVRFIFVGQAKTVALVGDFNEWGANPTPLSTTGTTDTWTVSVPVPSGRHEYAFIVDGKRWVADPFAPVNSDDFNTKSSIITVGS